MTTYFGRVYELTIVSDGTTIKTIDGFPSAENTPLQLQFTIDQTPNAERSYGEITVYGLNRESRDNVYQRGDAVKLVAGYAESYSTLFAGSIENIEIGRDGANPYIKLFCQSGVDVWSEAAISRAWGKNTSYARIIKDVAGYWGYPVEIVGDFSDFPRALQGKVFDSSVPHALRSLERSLSKVGYPFTWMLENDTVLIAREDAEREGAEDYRYTAATGLIGPPEITQRGVDITVLLNPLIRPRDTFRVEATNQQLTFGGIYYQGQDFAQTNGRGRNRAIALRHEGDFYSDTWETTIEGRLIA